MIELQTYADGAYEPQSLTHEDLSDLLPGTRLSVIVEDETSRAGIREVHFEKPQLHDVDAWMSVDVEGRPGWFEYVADCREPVYINGKFSKDSRDFQVERSKTFQVVRQCLRTDAELHMMKEEYPFGGRPITDLKEQELAAGRALGAIVVDGEKTGYWKYPGERIIMGNIVSMLVTPPAQTSV